MVTLWYPAHKLKGLSRAAYFPHYELIAGPSARLPSSRQAHAFEKAPPARAAQRFPAILFSHGLGENTARYSAQLEELASYGLVVVAIDHTYANQGVVFPDGRVVRFNDRWEWAFSSNGPDQERFIRGQLRVMVEDVSFVVDQLNKLNDSPSGVFGGKLDLSRLGFFGHSLGGAIAPLVCQTDRRFKACLNQDGLPTGQVLILDPPDGKLERPFMFFRHNDPVTEATLQLMALTRPEYEKRDRIWRQHAYHLLDTMPTESYVVSIRGAEHASFTDNPALAANTVSAYRSRARTLQVIRDYTRAFFSRYLLNENTRLLEGTLSEYPEVTVNRFGARVRSGATGP
jgi:dienelactone hydrolase